MNDIGFSSSYSTFLTTLDTIFDTRFTLLNILSPKVMDVVLDSNGYRDRVKDEFIVDGIKLSYESFLPHYERRHKGILKYSPFTFIPYIICSEINRHQYNNYNGDCFKPWEIHVNTYPYILTQEEKTNITKIFEEFLDQPPRITYHYLNKEEVTNDFLSTYDIEVVIDYHGFEWFASLLYENGVNYLKKRITLCIPKLLNTTYTQSDEMTDEVFKMIENTYYTYIDISFLDTYAFSNRDLAIQNKKYSQPSKS